LIGEDKEFDWHNGELLHGLAEGFNQRGQEIRQRLGKEE